MAAVDDAKVAGAELERLLPKVTKVYESDGPFYSSVPKGNVEVVSSRQMRIPMEIRPGSAFQYFDPDGGDMGRGSGFEIDKALVSAVFMSQNIEYTKKAEWSTNDRRKAVINTVRRQTKNATMEVRRQLDAQCMQSGNGVLGTITTVATASGVDTYTMTTDGFATRLVRTGQTVQVYDTTLATRRGSGVITLNDVENKTINVTPAVAGAVATDVIVVSGISSPASFPALFGVPYHHSNASTGTWLGYSRSNTPEIRASRVNAGGASFTQPLPRLAINKIANRVGMDNNFNPVAWTHPAQCAAYEEIGQAISIIQKQAKAEGLNLYFDALQMAGAPVKKSFNWDRTRIDFVVEGTWGRAEIKPIGFYTSGGRNIFELRGASGGVATADIFYMCVGMQMYVNNPAACAYIDNLAVPSGY